MDVNFTHDSVCVQLCAAPSVSSPPLHLPNPMALVKPQGRKGHAIRVRVCVCVGELNMHHETLGTIPSTERTEQSKENKFK